MSEGLKKLAVRTTREDVQPIQQKGKSVDGAEGWLNHGAALRTATSRPCGTRCRQRREVAPPGPTASLFKPSLITIPITIPCRALVLACRLA